MEHVVTVDRAVAAICNTKREAHAVGRQLRAGGASAFVYPRPIFDRLIASQMAAAS